MTDDRRNNDGASSLPERLPPANLEAERSLLGSCLLDDDVIDDCLTLVHPPDFFRAAHGEVWRAMADMRSRGTPIDGVTLADHLIRLGQYDKLGGNGLLRELTEAVPHAANAKYYAGIVREKSLGRRLIDACSETLRECYGREKVAADLICAAEERIFALADFEVGSSFPAREFIGESMAAIELRRDRPAGIGIETGLLDLDMVIGGMQPGSMIVLAARPSQGKTALALRILRHAAGLGCPVLFVSLEMTRVEIGSRLLSMESGIAGELLRDPRHMKESQLIHLRRTSGELSRLPIHIDDKAARKVVEIGAMARRTKHRHGLGLLVIDYLGLIDGDRQKGDSRQEEVARISRAIKAMARNLAVPVLVLHQLNRKSEDRDGRRPRLADLRDSGQIEADADIVLLLHRPEFYDPNDQPGIAELFVEKNRNGATTTVRLAFDRHRTKFDSLACVAEPAADSDTPY